MAMAAKKEPPWAPPPVLFMGAGSAASCSPLQKRFFSRRLLQSVGKRKAEEVECGARIFKQSRGDEKIATDHNCSESLEAGKHSSCDSGFPTIQVQELDKKAEIGDEGSKCDHGLTRTEEQPTTEQGLEELAKSEVVSLSVPDDELEEGELPEKQELSDLPSQVKPLEVPNSSESEVPNSSEPEVPNSIEPKVPNSSELEVVPLEKAMPKTSGISEGEFTLADWHAHITTGKPLKRAEENPDTKKNRKRKNRRANKQNAKKLKEASTSLSGSLTPGSTVIFSRPDPGDGLIMPKHVKKVLTAQSETPAPNAPSPMKLETVKPSVKAFQESSADHGKTKAEEDDPSKWSLSMLVEKHLGIWEDPEEDGEKKSKRSHKRPMTAERKQKKKSRDRIKRAEKLKQQGIVRRRPIVMVPDARPPIVCKYYLKGRCTKGAECSFSHEATPETKSELCKFFLTGSCMKLDDCPYSHETSKFPCKYFVTKGFCKDGDGCGFSHKPVTDEEEYSKVLKRVKSKINSEQQQHEEEQEEEEEGDDDEEYDPGTGAPAGADYDYGSSRWENEAAEEYDPAPVGAWWENGAAYSNEEDPEKRESTDSDLKKNMVSAAGDDKAAESFVTCSDAFPARKSAMEVLQETLKESGDKLFY